MVEAADTPAWIAMFLGLYALAAGIGEWRAPGGWVAMVADFERSAALRFLTGIVCIAVGAAIWLATSWRSDDWLEIVVAILGAWIVIEGVLFLALGNALTGWARRLMNPASRMWAGFSLVLGAALLAVALLRI